MSFIFLKIILSLLQYGKVRNIQLQRFIARLNRASFHFYEEHRARKVWERVSRRTYKLYI